jgi:lipoprotein-anchoring transpeptidase ErfK/SrfK
LSLGLLERYSYYYTYNRLHSGVLMHSSARLAILLPTIAASVALFAPQTANARDTVNFSEASAGTIVIKTNERRLYYVVGDGRAIVYPVGVGRAGKQWAGTSFIDSMRLKPAWAPPAEVRHDKPSLPTVIPGGTPQNPMGAAALTLSGGEYAIHGTNAPASIGGFVSYGCIRMHNADILDLYQRVHFGTRVIVSK